MVPACQPDEATAEFARILDAHGSAVYAAAFHMTGDRGAAEEIAQDAFVELWRTRPLLASPDHTRFWLRRVAVHRATDWHRKRMRRPTLVTDDGLAEVASARSNSERSVSRNLDTRLEGLLQSLPEKLRMAVVLRYGEDDMTPEEIAALLGQPVATVKSNLHRALCLLRRKAGTMLKEFARD